MYKKTRNLLRYTLIVCFLILSSISVLAIEYEKTDNNDLKFGATMSFSISVSDLEGNPITDSVEPHDLFRVNVAFELDNDVSAGETTVIQLPDALHFTEDTPFNIFDDEGHVIATCVVSGVDKTVTITYTERLEQLSDITGQFHFYVYIDQSVVTESQDLLLEFRVDSEVVNGGEIHYDKDTIYEPEPLEKYGYFDDEDSQYIDYEVMINLTEDSYSNAVVSDELDTFGMSYDLNSFTLYQGTLEISDGHLILINPVDVSSQYTMDIEAQSFTVSLGDIDGEVFLLNYRVYISYSAVDGEVFSNTATLLSTDEIVTTFIAQTRFIEAGGHATGYVYSIQVYKSDVDDPQLPLSGATFEVIRVRSGEVVGTITTDGEGKAEINGLLRDDYRLIEVQAPEGYQLDVTPITIESQDFDINTRTVFISMSNKKVDPPVTSTITISGKKIWEDSHNALGTRPDTIDLNLYANDGMVDIKPEWTKKGDIWEYKYSDLPEFENDMPITYRVVEVSISGYEASYDGFTITNTRISDTEEKEDKETEQEQPKVKTLPNTGGSSHYGTSFVITGVGVLLIVREYRKKYLGR